MKLFVSYSNCQGRGVIHFLRKTRLAETYRFVHYNNYQIILREQSAEDLMRDAAQADVFMYQPTPAIKYCELSTEEMVAKVVPQGARLVSFAYGFNDGLYPIQHHGTWRTGWEVIRLAKENPKELLRAYDTDALDFECRRRFKECLEEQRYREIDVDVRLAQFIEAQHTKVPLFISENHPCSAYFAEVARQVAGLLVGEYDPLPWSDRNEASLPCGMLIAPVVCKELGLEYAPDEGAKAYFREKILALIAEMKRTI